MAQCWIWGLTALTPVFQRGSLDGFEGSQTQSLAVPPHPDASSPEPSLFPAGAHCVETIFYKDKPSSSGDPKVTLPSNLFTPKPRSFALQSRGRIASVPLPGGAERSGLRARPGEEDGPLPLDASTTSRRRLPPPRTASRPATAQLPASRGDLWPGQPPVPLVPAAPQRPGDMGCDQTEQGPRASG